MSEIPAENYVSAALVSFRYHKQLAEAAVGQLPDAKLHEPLDENTNAIAVIMKHVAGNLRSRFTDFLTSDGEKPWRDRDREFADTFGSRDELMEFWEEGWNCLLVALESLGEEDLGRTVTIRGEPHSVSLAVARSLAHCAYHVGQIVLVARVLAKDNWQTLTIARGQSAAHNQQHWGPGQYNTR